MSRAPEPIIFDFGFTKLLKSVQEKTNNPSWKILLEISASENSKLEKGVCQEMLEIRVANSWKSWIWNQYNEKDMKFTFVFLTDLTTI